MSIAALTLALYHSKATYSNRLVLIAIANFEGEHGAFPSIETIGRLAGNLNRRTVQRSIDSLIELGELEEVRRDGITNLYRVTIACPEECDGTSYHRKKRGGGLQTTRVEIVHGGVASTTLGGGLQTTGGAVSRPPETLDKHIETNNRNNRATKLPPDWEPSQRIMDMFVTKWPDVDSALQIENFKLHWHANAKPMKNWDLVFQKWMNTEQDRAKRFRRQISAKEQQRLEQERIMKEWGQIEPE